MVTSMSKTIEVIIESESEDEEEYFEPLSDDVHNFNVPLRG